MGDTEVSKVFIPSLVQKKNGKEILLPYLCFRTAAFSSSLACKYTISPSISSSGECSRIFKDLEFKT
jgi:hypothetical protein